MRTIIAAIGGAAAVAAVLLPLPSASAVAVGDQPPECHKVKLIAPSGAFAWVVGCGFAPTAESPFQDATRYHRTLIMDGTAVISPAACPKDNPCVLFWVNGPGS
jgi:hypothetical protein